MKNEIEYVTSAIASSINPNDARTSLFPDHLIEALKIIGGESVAKQMLAPESKEFYSNNIASLIYRKMENGSDHLAQAHTNALSIAVSVKNVAPTFYKAVKEYSLGVHQASDLSQKNGVMNGYDNLALAKADRSLYSSLRHAYPAVAAKSDTVRDTLDKPKRKSLKP